ncbi:hypothetical protein [Acidithrix ferrooxidans]|uniref:Uncharacterized protein n=2 Tax=root TaxID=1 RepID=A0A0D8HI89_9ACTN|nr:hypothetical protein [Acidithrix ferrooxidans]KJF17477.1 hypothetical protein AXFE_16400 [Acidithrix ferrooxidans]
MPGMTSTPSHPFGTLGSHLYLIVGIIITVAMALNLAVYLFAESKPRTDIQKTEAQNIVATATSSNTTLSFLSISFGAIWIIDGMLQLRNGMPNGFVSNIIRPAFVNAPSFLRPLGDLGAWAWNINPFRVDLATAWIQLFIGMALVSLKPSKTWRLAIYLSIVWELIVFCIGNGFGLFYKEAAWYSGAPSAILIYLLVSVELLMASNGKNKFPTSQRLGWGLGIFFLVGTLLGALPSEGYFKPNGFFTMITSMAKNRQPEVFSNLLNAAANITEGRGSIISLILISLGLIIATALIVAPSSVATIYLTIIASLVMWATVMDFGVFSPTGTDFNSGLPIIMVSIALLMEKRKNLSNIDEPVKSVSDKVLLS